MFSFLLPLAIAQTSAASSAQAVPTPPAPPRCEGEAYSAFDFWVGQWDVFPNGSDSQVAESRIEKLYNGCAVRENWMPANGATGGSLNAFDPRTGQWHQTWIGSSPGRVEFTGGPHDGKMVLAGNWPSPQAPQQLIRMTYTPMDDGSVRQHGEASLDHGLSWSTSFDFIYRPKKDQSE